MLELSKITIPASEPKTWQAGKFEVKQVYNYRLNYMVNQLV